MTEGFLDFDEQPLEQFGVIVVPVDGQFGLQGLRFLGVDGAGPAIDPHRALETGNKEQQADAATALDIAIGLEKPVAGHIGQQ